MYVGTQGRGTGHQDAGARGVQVAVECGRGVVQRDGARGLDALCAQAARRVRGDAGERRGAANGTAKGGGSARIDRQTEPSINGGTESDRSIIGRGQDNC